MDGWYLLLCSAELLQLVAMTGPCTVLVSSAIYRDAASQV